ncbi:alpha/beta hydrolase family domain-containing protein [Purpureocillium lavendulum]|uniref:Alpha/beta hydrolase family domain-containing protein n=1 Tax=Purpureocillium lavendulum TaxID=1247861 RepID=A0AB34FEF6_9HYPO|nr:alpha/beta hydrolase family domain-containing protein [Purpureocillium lavendulum]
MGTVVGLHVYPTVIEPLEVKKVVLFFHGNTRSSRYMNAFLEELAGNRRIEGEWVPKNRERVVIARDFPGYDLSSQVPNANDSLETAATANDMAVYDWAIETYPKAKITVVGRSIGTLGWVNLLPLDHVTRAVAIVPFADPTELVLHVAISKISACYLNYIPGFMFALNKVLRAACDVAFPRGRQGNSRLVGFSPSSGIGTWEGGQTKRMLFFTAAEDALVPFGDAELLARAAKSKGADVEAIICLPGGHAALPTGHSLTTLQDFL